MLLPAAALAQPLPAKATVATDQGGDVVGVLHVSTVGVSERAAEEFERSLEEGLKLHGFRVDNRAKIQEYLVDSAFIAGCLFGPCLRTIWQVTKARVPLVLVARIEGQGSSYRFLISLLDTATGAPTAQIPTKCTVCTVEEAIAAATLAVVELVAGTGDARVLDPRGATGKAQSDKEAEGSRSRAERGQSLRRVAYLLWGAGAATGAAAAALLSGDSSRNTGWALAGTGAGLVIGGTTLFLFSRRF